MDQKDLDIIQSGDVDQSAVVFKRFVEMVKRLIQLNWNGSIDFNTRDDIFSFSDSTRKPLILPYSINPVNGQ